MMIASDILVMVMSFLSFDELIPVSLTSARFRRISNKARTEAEEAIVAEYGNPSIFLGQKVIFNRLLDAIKNGKIYTFQYLARVLDYDSVYCALVAMEYDFLNLVPKKFILRALSDTCINSAFEYAAKFGLSNAVKFLLTSTRYNRVVSKKHFQVRRPRDSAVGRGLYCAAARNHIETMEVILNLLVCESHTYEDKINQAFVRAAYRNQLQAVKFLESKGATDYRGALQAVHLQIINGSSLCFGDVLTFLELNPNW